MDDTVTTNDGHFVCLECKNAMDLAKELKIGDVIECEFGYGGAGHRRRVVYCISSTVAKALADKYIVYRGRG